MKKLLIILFTVVLAAGADAQIKDFFKDVEGHGRIGYSIGGNAPIPMPSTIRSLNKYTLQPNLSVGLDACKPVKGRLGIAIGARFENKGMHIDADVKNYHMEIIKGGDKLTGVFTGKNNTKVTAWMFTFPIQCTYNIKPNLRLKLGPYISLLTLKKFEGFAYDGYLRVDNPTGEKVLLGSEEGSRGDYDFNKEMSRSQLGIDLGIDWYFTRRVGVYADLAWGLTGTFPHSFKTLEQTLHPIYGTIGVTYKIR